MHAEGQRNATTPFNRNPISIFRLIKGATDERQKTELTGLLTELKEKCPKDYKIGAAVGKGDCFFDSVAQGLNELKSEGLITNSKNFNVKLLRSDCADYANKYKDKIIKDAEEGGYARMLLGPEINKSIIDNKETFGNYLKNIKKTSEEFDNVIWGRPEIEGEIVCEKYEVKIEVMELRDEQVGGLHVTTCEIGTSNNVAYIVNYRNHFVPLLNSIEKDIEECEEVYREEMCSIVDRNGLRSLSEGEKSLDYTNCNEESTIHVLTEENVHSKPILDGQKIPFGRLDSDEERARNAELFDAIRKDNLSNVKSLLEDGVKTDIIDRNNKDNSPLHYAVEKGTKKIVEELLLRKWETNVNFLNSQGNTPLHIAASRGNKELVQLLLNDQAEVGIKNNDGKIPLDVAKCKDIVQILESHVPSNEQASTGKQSASQQQAQQNINWKSIGNCEHNMQPLNQSIPKQSQEKRMFPRRSGTTGGLAGNFYEINLLTLAKLRAERNTGNFCLTTHVSGLGAFDDVVIRYKNGDSENEEIILLQVKHAENPEKRKITIDKFKNPKSSGGKFYLGKYLVDYLKSKEKFSEKCTDLVFNGNFKELDVRYIIYTNSVLDEGFDKSRKMDVKTSIFSTKFEENKDRRFKFRLDAKNDDLIEVLKKISSQERMKSLAKALVSCFIGKLNHNKMMANEFIKTYHVFLSRNVIEVNEKKTVKKDTEYREGKIKQKFLEFSNKDHLEIFFKEQVLYEYTMSVVFSKKGSSKLNDKSERDDLLKKAAESLKSSKEIGTDVIEKLAGSAIILDTNDRKLKFADQDKIKDESVKQFIEDLRNQVGDLTDYKFDIPYTFIKKALKEQVEKVPLKLYVGFGNMDPSFKKPEHLIQPLIQLFKQYKSQKVVKIDDDMVGREKILTSKDIKNMRKLVGNLLVFDQRTKMLRLVKEENVDGNVLEFIKKLRTTAQSDDVEPYEYSFDIKVKTFPRSSLTIEDEDRVNVEEFLSKLEIFTGEASNEELEDIIKDKITALYGLTRNEAEDKFLKIKDKALSFWKQGDYLKKNDYFFTNILGSNIQFDMKEPVVSFTGRDKELEELYMILQDRTKVITSQGVAITGFGGLGKSELARKYASKYGDSYDGGLIWINAESHQTLTESFSRLADNKLKISIRDKDGNVRGIKAIVEDVYRFFAKGQSLFVFDDAEGYEAIKECLPCRSLYTDNKNPHILITSHDCDWTVGEEREIKVMNLKVFKPNEAEKFVKDFLEIKDDSQNYIIRELTKQLQYFPLALRQAVAYIKQEDEKLNKRGNGRFDTSRYLEKRQQQENNLLDKGYYKRGDRYAKTVFTTWITTLEKIAEDQNYGRQAVDILNVMAYFLPDKIDMRELFSMSEADKKWSAVELLDRYSMINLKSGVVSIHSLVQYVIMQKVKSKKNEEKILKKAIKGIDNSNISEEGMNHVISVWDYASEHPELIRNFCTKSLYGSEKYTPIHLLVKGNKKEGMDRILKIQPKMKDARNTYGETPLYAAIVRGYNEIIECLIGVYNVNPEDEISSNHHTPITVAAFHGKEDLVKYFVSKGANVNSHILNMFSTLYFAIFSCNKSLVKYLLDQGAEVYKSGQLCCCLHLMSSAINERHSSENDVLEIIKLCLQKDHDLINRNDLEGRSLLHFAVKDGHTNIVKMLLEEGVNVNATTYISSPDQSSNFSDIQGHDRFYTALHIAAEGNNMEIVMALLKHGAHYNVRNLDSKTPQDLAKPASDVRNLLSCIDDLFKAIQSGKKDEVDFLLKERNGIALEAILHAKNTDGYNLIRAASGINKDIAYLLIEKFKIYNVSKFRGNKQEL